MSKRILIPLLLIVVLPVGLIGWLGVRVAVEDRQVVERNLVQVVQQRLSDISGRVSQLVQRLERELSARLLAVAADPSGLSKLRRDHDLVRQTFWVKKNGLLRYPDPKGVLSRSERRFLRRTRQIWHQRAILIPPGNLQSNVGDRDAHVRRKRAPGSGDSIIDLAARRPHGWITWYWAEGLHLLFWQRLVDGDVVGVEVDRIALMARVIGELPDTTRSNGRIVLRDSGQAPIYQFGRYRPRAGERPVARLSLLAPLHTWSLAYFGPQSAVKKRLERRVRLNIAVVLGLVVLGLCALAVHVYREYSREMRLAAQRVGFVTQVSHELKTPLTNIRLYAELMQGTLDEGDQRSAKRLAVIVGESQRLSRLINNILTFSKQQRAKHRIQPTSTAVDAVIQRTAEQFEPALAAQEIALDLDLDAPRPVAVDADALEQIVGNLLSNIEKYATAGGTARIESRQTSSTTEITVNDNGPGVPPSLRERIFEPFERGSDRLSDGVTGTGIGLSISRELARAHGGDLRLLPSPTGACFVLTLPDQQGGTR